MLQVHAQCHFGSNLCLYFDFQFLFLGSRQLLDTLMHYFQPSLILVVARISNSVFPFPSPIPLHSLVNVKSSMAYSFLVCTFQVCLFRETMETRIYSNIIITKQEKGIPIMLLGIKLRHSSKGKGILKEELLIQHEHFQRDIFYFYEFNITPKYNFMGGRKNLELPLLMSTVLVFPQIQVKSKYS